MGELFTKVIEFFETITPKKLKIFASLVILVLCALPFAWYYFMFYSQLEHRIEILKSVANIDPSNFSNDILKQEYNDILEQVNKHGKGFQIDTTDLFEHYTSNSVKWTKFFTGGIWFWLLFFISPLAYKKNYRDMLLAMVLLLIFGGILGFISMALPTFRVHQINYLGWPIVQISIVIIIGVIYTRQKKKPIGVKSAA